MSDNDKIIEQLSVQVLEQAQKTSALEVNLLESRQKIQELKRLLVESRKQKEESDKEVERLSYEMEDLSATLFDQANEKVKTANIQINDVQVKNEKLVDTLKDRDMTIELLNNELKNLKTIISDFETEEKAQSRAATVEPQTAPESQFTLDKLLKFNGKHIYSPMFNQLRFDLTLFNQFEETLATLQTIRETSFYKHLVTEEIEPVLRLDLSPSVKFFQKKSFVTSLFESKVVIEPLSASTEAWKAAQTQSAPSSPDPTTKRASLKMFKYDTNLPVAVESKCSICGEARMAMNFARLYVLRVKEVEYLLCISCASKLRRTVDLLARLKALKQTTDEGEVIRAWCEIAELRGRLFYAKLGIWDDADEGGLVYGWKNSWLGLPRPDKAGEPAEPATEETAQTAPSPVPAPDVPPPVSKRESDIPAATPAVPGSTGTPGSTADDILDTYANTSDEEVFNDASEAHSVAD